MEIAFEPYDKITFRSYMPYENIEEFTKVLSFANPPGVPFHSKFFWANGVLFRVFNQSPSEALASEVMKGHFIFEHIEFAPMPHYAQSIKIPERPMGALIVLDVSKHAVFAPLTAWIQKNLLKK